jgi:chaperonin GroES
MKKLSKKVKAKKSKNTVLAHKRGNVPFGDRVLVRPVAKEERTASGIIIPDTVSVGERGENKRGRVVAVGEGRYEEGKLVPMRIKVGDEVLYQWGEKVEIDGEEHYIVSETNILMTFN